MTEILQISFDLHPKYDLDQHRLEEHLKKFGLECGDTGAGFGRRDLEFYMTKPLTDTEFALIDLDLNSFKALQGMFGKGIPGIEWSWYDEECNCDDCESQG